MTDNGIAMRATWAVRKIGLRPPAPGRGRAHYYASHGAIAFGVAVTIIVGWYALSYAGWNWSWPIVRFVAAVMAATAYLIAIRCLAGFWSVPAVERESELSSLETAHKFGAPTLVGWIWIRRAWADGAHRYGTPIDLTELTAITLQSVGAQPG